MGKMMTLQALAGHMFQNVYHKTTPTPRAKGQLPAAMTCMLVMPMCLAMCVSICTRPGAAQMPFKSVCVARIAKQYCQWNALDKNMQQELENEGSCTAMTSETA